MSLNGLDDAMIVEAHGTAISEPGGWLLLKYSTRDEVELLGRGNGGIIEMRNTVVHHDETSPMYGFLKYRRRNVVIKYLPQDCSRLIQARVAVHFNAICERFSPYDTTFDIATASELRDAKLSAACSLHAASCSTSSSTSSLRRRRLMEIAEEEEEEQRATKRHSVQEADGGRPKSPAACTPAMYPVTLNSTLAASPEQSKFSADSTSELPTFVGVDDRPASPTKLNGADLALFSHSSYPYNKAKVKLGPRPSLDVSGRPQTAGNFRPVSAIPAGFKLFGRSGKRDRGGKVSSNVTPHEETVGLNTGFSDIATPQESLRTQGDTARPTTSSGLSVESINISPPLMSKKQIISPEKARLIKAMQLREKKKKSMQPPVTMPSSHDEATREGQDPPAETNHAELHLVRADDSRVGLGTPALVHTDQTSDLTQSDSRPASPEVAASSETGRSTKPSLSGSTDETVRAKDDETSPDHEAGEPEPLSEQNYSILLSFLSCQSSCTIVISSL